jgi:hypothetical protein
MTKMFLVRRYKIAREAVIPFRAIDVTMPPPPPPTKGIR